MKEKHHHQLVCSHMPPHRGWSLQPRGLTRNQTDGLLIPGLMLSCWAILAGLTFIFLNWFESEKHWCEKHWIVASHIHPDQGSNSQQGYVPWLGIKSATFQCMGWHFNQMSHIGHESTFKTLVFKILLPKSLFPEEEGIYRIFRLYWERCPLL